MTAVLADDATESPAAFVATTENVYAVPFVSPVKSHCKVGGGEVLTDNEHTSPSGDDVTRYDVTGAELVAAADHDTRAAPAYAVALGAVVADGTVSEVDVVAGVTAEDVLDTVEVPTAFFATTTNVIAVPLASPVNAQDVDPDVEQVAPFEPVTV